MTGLELKPIAQGTITSPRGFVAGACCSGIKQGDGVLDLGMLCSEAPCVAAGVFTTNKVKAAPVLLCQQRLAAGSAQAVVVNSCLLYTSPSPRDLSTSRMPSSA